MFRRKKKTPIEKARQDIEKQLKVVNKQAKQTRKEIVSGLNNTASDLRSGISTMLNREEQKTAQRVASELEVLAKSVETRANKQLDDVTAGAKDNVWGSLTIAVLVGIILGVIIKSVMDD